MQALTASTAGNGHGAVSVMESRMHDPEAVPHALEGASSRHPGGLTV